VDLKHVLGDIQTDRGKQLGGANGPEPDQEATAPNGALVPASARAPRP
jgi:hypothetical protein